MVEGSGVKWSEEGHGMVDECGIKYSEVEP